MLQFDLSKARRFVSEEEMQNFKAQTELAKDILVKGTGAGNDFLGWVDLPEQYDKAEFQRRRFGRIRMFFWSSVSAVPTLGQERQTSF